MVRFEPVAQRHDPPETPLSAELTLRWTIRHPDLSHVFRERDRRAMTGTCLGEESRLLEREIWAELDNGMELPLSLGQVADSARSEPLVITQLLLLYHLLDAVR